LLLNMKVRAAIWRKSIEELDKINTFFVHYRGFILQKPKLKMHRRFAGIRNV
jgi:hypothetical protein